MPTNSQLIGRILGPVVFFITLWFFRPEGLSEQGVAVLASTLWVVIWWVTSAIPIAATALLPIVLFPLTGAAELSDTTAAYGHRYVFLYIGGFMIAIGIEKWNLHKRIALSIISLIGTNVSYMILGFMVATAFLSMWISNTATSIMMLPIGIAIIAQLKDNPKTLENETQIFGKALMLAIAYSASIGGIATLIGTPPNLVLAGVVEETYGIEISFAQWLLFGLPISITLLFICWQYLTRVAFKIKDAKFPGGIEEIRRQKEALGPIGFEEKLVLGVFALAALSWISRSFLLVHLLPGIDDTIIGLGAALLMFVLPTSKKEKGSLMDWESAVKLPWGILLLFGGGLAIAHGIQASGLSAWIGSLLAQLEAIHLLIILFILIAAVNFLTEIPSNLATTAMILPVIAAMALSIDVHPYILLIGATVAASCAFMLPVATPPNAVVFGSGYLRIPDMMRAGFALNLISILLIALLTYFVLPELWGFVPDVFPDGF